MTRKLAFLIAFATFPLISRATNLTLQGNFAADDSLQLFSVSVAGPAAVEFRSYGYAGGTTSTGTLAPRGGFDTILTLFSASGVFIEDNDDGAGVAVDPATGLAGDARITANLAAGKYLLALTQYDNFSIGNLSDGFAETGNPNFTAAPSFALGGPCPGNMFRDISGTAGRCRTGNWTVDFVNVANATAVPEPSALLLAGIGFSLLLLLVMRRRRHRRKATLLACGLATALASVSLQAQTTCPSSTSGPDYCHVSDFLNGQRTLLDVTDIQVFRQSKNPYTGEWGNSGGDYNLSNNIEMLQISTKNSQQPSATPIVYNSDSNTTWYADSQKPVLSLSAFMFNQAGASTLTTMGDFNHTGTFALWLQNVASLNGSGNPGLWYPLPNGDNPSVTSGAVGDLTQDGYDDLALAFDDGRLLVLAPKDVNNVYANFNEAMLSTALLNALAIGDFKGDGHREVVGITINGSGGPAVAIYTVDPVTLALTAATTLNLTPPSDASASNPVTHVSMARGRFNSAGHDQLAVTFATNSGSSIVEVIDFTLNTLNPVEGPQLTASKVAIPSGYLEVKTGQFALPGSTYDQIVFHTSSANDGGKFFEILSVDPPSLALTAHGAVPYGNGQIPCAAGIQVGNFDHRQADPLNPSQTQPDPNAQIAFMYCGGPPPLNTFPANTFVSFIMNIYSADPTTLNLNGNPDSARQLGSDIWINPNANSTNVVSVTFTASDIQGRSVTLGEPTKISIDNTAQPSAVVGVPPMHVDFIDPGDGNGPRVFNVSVVPDSFYTTYNQENSTGYKSSITNTTSWSFGAKETASAGVTIGDPDLDGLKATDTFTAAQKLNGSHQNDRSSYKEQSFNLSTTTGFGDLVSYTDSQFNIWVYPVIGQTVCPAGKPNCQPGEKVPLTIQFSAPDGNSLKPEAVQGQALQWYQPPWEPGNILSYPANVDQLTSYYPDLVQLTDATGFLTDGSTVTQTATWSGQGETSNTTGLEQNYSFENDFSVNGSIGVGDIGSLQLGAGLDVSGSVGFSSLIKGTSTLGSSTGLQIYKPGTFPAFQNYAYAVSPYIMGTMPPAGLVDNQPPGGNIQTAGVLRAVFTADPLSTTPPAGGWWGQAYVTPDVALNHPGRWTYTANPLPGSGDPPTNCLVKSDGKSMDCAELSPRSPKNPWLDIFHFMRGFFISNSLSPGQGPQLEQAKAGDILALQTRVYNYSFAPMPAGTQVHVRFYFMPWNPTRSFPAEPNGNSYLISEETVNAIPAFNNETGPDTQPNWTLVSTTFDTSKFQETKNGNAHLVFWVLVWMQDANGNLISEMPGHGLTGIPSAGAVNPDGETTVHYPGVAQFEECQPPDASNQVGCYSNNLGFYKQVFYINEPSLGATLGSTAGSLDIGKVDVSANQVTLSDTVALSAMLSTRGGPASGVSVNFYDGNPQQTGRLFAVERIPHIAEDGEYLVQTTYQPNTCGVHQLFTVINRGRANEIVRRAQPVRVACKAP